GRLAAVEGVPRECPAASRAGKREPGGRVVPAFGTIDQLPGRTAVHSPVGGRTELRQPMLSVEEPQGALRPLARAGVLPQPVPGAVCGLEDPERARRRTFRKVRASTRT